MQAFTIAIITLMIVVAIAIAARVEVTVVVAAATKVATIELRSIKVIDCSPTMEPWK